MNKPKLPIFIVGLVLMFTFIMQTVWAQTVSRLYFDDYELTKSIANRMPLGSLEKFDILSTAVVNDVNGFYLLAKLSNGQTRRIFLNDLYTYIKDNSLLLADNQVLVIDEQNELAFFDKNDFHRQAFNAQIFMYSGPVGDPYEGINVPYKIKDFSLLPEDISFGNDLQGNKYFYRILMQNGKEVFLSLNQAYKAYKENRFVSSTDDSIYSLGKITEVSYVNVREPLLIKDVGALITIEVRYKNDVFLPPESFVFEIKKSNSILNGQYYYFFDIYVPNSQSQQSVAQKLADGVGFIDRVDFLKDSQDFTRMIIRCYINQQDYDFLNTEPKIEAIDSKSYVISFVQSFDQTSQQINYAVEPVSSEALFEISNKVFSLPFYSNLSEVLTSINNSVTQNNIVQKIQGLISGIEQLDKVGALAENDYQLLEVINYKKETRQKIYELLENYLYLGLRSPDFNKNEALDLIDTTDGMFDNPLQQKEISYYKQLLQ